MTGKVLKEDDIALTAAGIVRDHIRGAEEFDVVKVHYAGERMVAGYSYEDYGIEEEATLNAHISMMRWSTGHTPELPKCFGCAAAASVGGNVYVIGGFDGRSAMNS